MAHDLTEDELQLLSSLPQAIGGAMAIAGRSGLFGTGKEMLANSQALLAGAKDFPGNALIRDILPDLHASDRGAEMEQMKKTRDWSLARVKARGIDSAEKLTAMVLEDCREAARVLDAKVGGSEATQYRQWVMNVADKVAQSATEGGFLGFGGERLSTGEQKLLGEIKGALGVA